MYTAIDHGTLLRVYTMALTEYERLRAAEVARIVRAKLEVMLMPPSRPKSARSVSTRLATPPWLPNRC